MLHKCDLCKKELPGTQTFYCNSCGGYFCAYHIHPQDHNCNYSLAKKRWVTRDKVTNDYRSRTSSSKKSNDNTVNDNLKSKGYDREPNKKLNVPVLLIAFFAIFICIGVLYLILTTQNTNAQTGSNGNFFGGVGSWLSGIGDSINNLINPPIYSETLMLNGNTYLAYPDGSNAQVTIYRNATDPTYNQLMNFLRSDDTCYTTYVPGQYVCINFAVHLSDDAERQGIKAHIVDIEFTNGPGHDIDAFDTTDNGWVFVDATGMTADQKAMGAPCSTDIVNLVNGGQYIPVPINPTNGWTTPSMGTVSEYTIVN